MLRYDTTRELANSYKNSQVDGRMVNMKLECYGRALSAVNLNIEQVSSPGMVNTYCGELC